MTGERRNRVRSVGEPSARASFEMTEVRIDDDDEEEEETMLRSDLNANTVRRTQSLHKNAFVKRERKGRRAPRHIAHYATIRGAIPSDVTDGTRPNFILNTVEQIVNEMELNDNLMQDTPDGEARRIETLRDIPQSLSVKRNIRVKLSASVSRKSKRKPIGVFKLMRYRFSFWFHRVNLKTRDLLFSLEPWYKSIKMIEGHFGSGVGTYFRFLRWLFVMNLCVSVVSSSFIVIPQIIRSDSVSMNTQHLSFWDFFTGQGHFTNTTLYYGFYTNDFLNGESFNIPYAYLLIMVLIYLATFVFLSLSMERSYRINYIKTSIGLKNRYANKIFCCWDFTIATDEAANLKSKSFYSEIKELICDNEIISNTSCMMKVYSYGIKIIMHLFVFSILAAIGATMWHLLEKSFSAENHEYLIANIYNRPLWIALTITTVMLFGPIIFDYISKFENYNNPRTTLYVTLFRTFILEFIVVAILCSFWLKSRSYCWETSFAQEIYRLIIFDFLISVIFLPMSAYLQQILHRRFSPNVGCPKFNIARNTLGLIYNQTLLWMGLFFSPLLPILVTIKFWLLFYINKSTMFRNCRPSGKPWRAAQMQTMFLFLIFFLLLCIIFTLGYIFLSVPTTGCGPFRNDNYIYLVFQRMLKIEEDDKILKFIKFITKPGFVALLLIAMSVAICYLRAEYIEKKSQVKQLRKFLGMQSKDKDFLLTAIKNVSEGKWIYNLKESSLLESANISNLRTPCNANFQLSPRFSEKTAGSKTLSDNDYSITDAGDNDETD